MRKLSVLCLLALTSQAFSALPNQPAVVPADGDHGAYSTRDAAALPSPAEDPLQAKAYDNFTLTSSYVIDAICWSGIYAEPFPSAGQGGPNDTDFIVQIWGNSGGHPNQTLPTDAALFTFKLEGGLAGVNDGVVVTNVRAGQVAPVTATNPVGGGLAYDYSAALTPTVIPAGSYWISIQADQEFDNPVAFDPEWQWHLGSGPGDGFFTRDFQLDPLGTPVYGIKTEGKDLAFQLKGSVVPEPAGMVLGLFAIAGAGLLRRKRS